MALDETTLEDRLQAWVAAAVSPTPVIWDRQGRPQPGVPYLTLRLTGPAGPGAFGELHDRYDPAGAAGQEIERNSIHHHEYTLRVQSYAPTPRAARALVLAVHDRAYRESGRDALRTQDPPIALAEVGTVQDLGALIDTDWQGRAALEFVIRVADVDPERTTFIETVGLVDDLS